MAKKAPVPGSTVKGNKLIIVPDSCSLVSAGTPIPDHFFIDDPKDPHYVPPQKRPKTLLDIYLNYLPRDKVKGIHVLDIIGAEVFGRAADGKLFDESFGPDASGRPKKHYPEDLAKILYEQKDPFIKLLHTKAGGALIEALKDFARLEQSMNGYLALLPKDKASKISPDVRKELKHMRNRLRTDRGEAIIHEHLMAHPQPTLFLSEDSKARKQVIDANTENHRGCVYVCNTNAFLQILKENGILQSCGMQDWVTPQHLILEISRGFDRFAPTQRAMTSHLHAIPGEGKVDPKPLSSWFTLR